MTVPGTRVTSVRRTVRVAVALVTGQALLCGIIGVLTFGGGGDGGGDPAPGVRTTEPRLAGPPLVVPPAELPPPGDDAERPRTATSRPFRTQRPASSPAPAAPRVPRPSRTPATETPAPTRTAPITPVPPKPPETGTTPTGGPYLSPSPQASVDDPPAPVAGERCDDAGATGRTAGGRAVRCERDRDGDLRWVLV